MQSNMPQLRHYGSPSLESALNGKRIPGLDFLRAVAVLLVLLDHSGLGKLGPISMFNGGIGVEIFFVLSGFLITWLLLEEWDKSGTIGLIGFYRRRAARLLPAFYGYVLIGLLYLTLRGLPIPWAAIGYGMFYVLNYYQGLTGAEPHFLSHCWSLAVEEQFYVLWPFALLMLCTRRFRVDHVLILSILAIWILRPTLLFVFDVSDAYLYRALETRADHLAVGCLLAVLMRQQVWRTRFENVWKRKGIRFCIMLALPLLLVVSATLQSSVAYKYSIGYALEPLLIGMLIPFIILSSQAPGLIRRVVLAPIVLIVGEISYGMYLIHQLVLYPVRTGVERLTGSFGLATLISVLVVTALAYLSFRYFESPLRTRFRGNGNQRRG